MEKPGTASRAGTFAQQRRRSATSPSAFLILSGLLLLPVSGRAAGVPNTLAYTGHLDHDGVPVNDTVAMTFALWTTESGSTPAAVWTETQTAVSVVNGAFSTLLGSVTPIPDSVFQSPSLWLSVRVGTADLGGRQRINSAPFARKSGFADHGVPSGTVIAFAGTTVPEGWLQCDGALVNRAEYPRLFAAIQTNYGAGDGSTTFKLPDYRGVFLRGFDPTSSRDPEGASRSLNTLQGDATALPKSPFSAVSAGAHAHTFDDYYFSENIGDGINWGWLGSSASDRDNRGHTTNHSTATDGAHSHSLSGGDSETRPKNMVVRYLIKI